MRSVRCKTCGTKALMAASQCPKCGELFEVRDGFGELVPLAYCSTCDSYYPESLGECRWCGTKPDRAPIAPHVWKGVGVAACVVLLGIGWLTRESRPKHTPNTRSTASRKVDSLSRPADTVAMTTTDAVVTDTANVGPLAPVAPTTSVASQGAPRSAPQSASQPAAQPVAQPASRVVAASPPSEAPTANTPAAATPKARRPAPSARWVASVAKTWVVVRADASRTSRIVASVGPGSRVQLGETRDSWRRIRARGIAGWVEPKSSFAAGRTPTKASLAAR